MSQYASRGVGYSGTTPTENMLLIREKSAPLDGTRKGILCFHGHGGTCDQFDPNGPSSSLGPGYHAWQLAEAGFLVGAIDDAGGTAWSDQSAMDRATDGYSWLGSVGARSGKVGLVGWSMGGLTVLNWIKRNPTLVAGAWLWAPCSDLDWANSTSGYTPAYGGSVANNGTWSTEIQADYNPYASASNGFRVRDEYASWQGLGVPIKVCHASDDTTVPVAQSQTGFVPGVNDSSVTLRSPVPTGNHSGLFGSVPASEVLAFFEGLSW